MMRRPGICLVAYGTARQHIHRSSRCHGTLALLVWCLNAERCL
jgi:hypothetical protein